MSLSAKEHYVLEMSVVNMSVDSEKPFEYNFDDVHEILWEWYPQSTREYFLIVKLIFNPSH